MYILDPLPGIFSFSLAKLAKLLILDHQIIEITRLLKPKDKTKFLL